MEFTDPLIAEQELAPNDKPGDTPADKAVGQLQDEIDKAYTGVEKKFAQLWSSASKNATDIQEKLKWEEHRQQLAAQLGAARKNIDDKTQLTEHLRQFEAQFKSLSAQVPEVDLKTLSTQANGVLDSLDSKLEVVEKEAGKYVSQFTSFLSSMVSVAPPAVEKETLFSTQPSANYGSSRYETDLFKLHTTAALIEDAAVDGEADFNADDKTDDIAQLLQKYESTLGKLQHELVPVKVPYNVFWSRYFALEAGLRQQEQHRKALLAAKPGEEFTWDDDDDEEPVDVAREAPAPADNDDDDDWE